VSSKLSIGAFCPRLLCFCFEIRERKPTYKKDCDPCKTNIVKRNGTTEWIDFARFAICVVKIPVDTIRFVDETGFETGKAVDSIVTDERRKSITFMHPRTVLSRTYKLLFRIILVVK
jgi:hypothetical protein